MRLTYVFDRWRVLPLHRPALVVASLGVEMRVNGVMSPVGHIYVVPDSAGVVRFPVQDGLTTPPMRNVRATLATRLKVGPMRFSRALPAALAVALLCSSFAAPPVRAEQGVKDQFLRSVDPNRVRLGMVAPTHVLGALPIGGVVSVQVKTPAGRVARADAPPAGG